MTSLTKEQQLVVDLRGQNLLLSASAGSGKTFTMVERIIDLIKKDKVSLSQMLIVTFTNAAAQDLKQKIYKELFKKAKEDPTLIKQLNELNLSDISTLHTFCGKILRQYFFEVGIDPAFKIIDESSSSVLINDSFNAVLREYEKEGDEDFFYLFEAHNSRRSDIDFKEVVLKVYSFLKTKNNYVNFAKKIVEKTYSTDLAKNPAAIYLNQYMLEQMEHFKGIFTPLYKGAKALRDKGLIDLLKEILTFIKNVKEAKGFEARFNLLAFTGLSQIPRSVSPEAINLKEELKAQKEIFTKTIKDFVKEFGTEDIKTIKNNLEVARVHLNKLLEVVLRFDEEYKLQKLERALLDFNDLEHYTLELLNVKTIKESIKNKYQHIFIDEYQDTNPMQEQIISKIAGANNLFMVGDVKQSIYMFRQCDPQIFVDKYNIYKKEKEGIKVDLNKNFRSEKAILEFSNFVFSNIMQEEVANVNYRQTSVFVAGAEYDRPRGNMPLVELNIIDKLEKIKSEQEEKLDLYSVKNHINQEEEQEEELAKLEAHIVAQKIDAFVGEDIYDLKQKKYRKAEFGDIAILSRYKGDYLKTLCEELQGYGIPISASYSYNIYQTYEVLLVYNFLRLINNFNDDLALISVLTSDLFKVSFEELSKVRIFAQKSESFYLAIKEFVLKNPTNDTSLKIQALMFDLEELRKKTKYLKVPKLISALMDRYQLENHFLSLPQGVQRLENLQKMLEDAKKPQIEGELFTYLDYIETFGKEQTIEVSTAASKNSVQVSTIHASKGLEYPIVILAGAGRDFTKARPKDGDTLLNKELGFGLKYYDFENRTKGDTLARIAIKYKNKTQELAEQMRLLYVALTRAQNHLVIVGQAPLSKIERLQTPYEVLSARSYLDWILGSFKAQQLKALKDKKEKFDISLGGEITCQVLTFDPVDFEFEKEDAPQIVFNKPDKVYLEQLEKVFSYVYPHAEAKELSLKSSVSEIMLKDLEEDCHYSIKQFKLKEFYSLQEEVDFSKIGTLHHEVMQNIDFNLEDKAEVDKAIRNMVKEGKVPSEALEFVSPDKVFLALKAIRSLLDKALQIKKEQQFMMYSPYNQVVEDSNLEDKILIQGVVDLIIVKKEGIIIVDYKTTRAKSEKEMAKKYYTQLNLYAKAVENALGKKVLQKLIYSFELNSLINV